MMPVFFKRKYKWRKAIFSVLSVFAFIIFVGCNAVPAIKEIHIGLHHNNELKIEINVLTAAPAKVYAEYWSDNNPSKKYISTTSAVDTQHALILCNIIPQTNYSYRLITEQNDKKSESKIYTFQSHSLPMWLRDQFKDTAAAPQSLPDNFKKGLMLINKRETPGMLYMADYNGNLRWYHMIDGTGFKVTHFTKDKTIISILGKNDEPTSYGSEILEINLLGDTLLHLKKGQADLKYTIHHEVLKKSKNEIVTLFVEDRIMDLTSVGGKKVDTVKGDGILIMDTTGKKIWQWSVFDAVDPLKDPAILKTKSDWMHANSLSYDRDNNFLISFYNNGQIWKLDAQSGKIMWKLGKGGDITLPQDCDFTQTHAVHINHQGSLMFFDNGVERKQSEVFALKINEAGKIAQTDFHFKLPKEIYNDRMGSSYMVNDSAVLSCCSKRHVVVLTNKKGDLLWTLDTAIPPYRVEFLTEKDIEPVLQAY
ncbi:MAG: aryl-sulfate sulfotransferase [Agriterribacter sp.]